MLEFIKKIYINMSYFFKNLINYVSDILNKNINYVNNITSKFKINKINFINNFIININNKFKISFPTLYVYINNLISSTTIKINNSNIIKNIIKYTFIILFIFTILNFSNYILIKFMDFLPFFRPVYMFIFNILFYVCLFFFLIFDMFYVIFDWFFNFNNNTTVKFTNYNHFNKNLNFGLSYDIFVAPINKYLTRVNDLNLFFNNFINLAGGLLYKSTYFFYSLLVNCQNFIESFKNYSIFDVIYYISVKNLNFWNEIYINSIFYNFVNTLNLPIFMYFYILYALSTFICLLLLSYLGFYGVFIINLIILILFFFSLLFYLDDFFINNFSYIINLGKWFVINHNFIVNFTFYLDPISFSFMFLTLTIAVFVYIYAFSYFRYEPNVERLILLINSFVISMICLVISGNFFVLFLGWELIGLTSFFLINFWSTRMSTVKSAFKAFVFNKLSDVSLLLVVLLVFFLINDININIFNYQISYYNNFYIYFYDYKIPFIELISFCFIICAFIKSAQFGFHVWLPDSMEAPVPASALIHSATLVSAGVFLLLRFTSMFEYSIYAYYIIPLVGSFTAFFGGICSCYQSDIKRILAYSTISHCGFLMIAYSTYITEYVILYLYIHGFFKAAVFLCVGNIIRFNRNNQDFRTMGGFWKYLPFECFSSLICLVNLSGLPFTIGFYIKHLLLIGVYLDNLLLYFIFINILGGAISGLFYSYRLFYYVFFDIKKAKKIIYLQANRNNLKSIHYSNTTLASNIAISGLIIISYIISLYLINISLNKNSFGEGLDIYSLNSSQYEEFNYPLLSLISNIGYFNWILIIIILIIITSSWRIFFLSNNIYINIYFFILFIIFFSLFIYI